MKRALVLRTGSFVGNHFVNSLKKADFWVRGVDLKLLECSSSKVDEFSVYHLKKSRLAEEVLKDPAAICRKIDLAKNREQLKMWGEMKIKLDYYYTLKYISKVLENL